MSRYLLDSNHLSAYLDRTQPLVQRVQTANAAGHRFWICLAVLCEYQAGIRISRRYQQNLARLQAARTTFRVWPSDENTAIEFGELFRELRAIGRALNQFDLLIAAVARQHRWILLTADQDFQPVSRLLIENWL